MARSDFRRFSFAVTAFCLGAASADAQEASGVTQTPAPSRFFSFPAAWAETIANLGEGEPAKTWPADSVINERANCATLLKNVTAVVVPEEPFRDDSCGAPAAVRLISIGKSPHVSFSPPPVVTCKMVASLAYWIDKDLQPLARRHLGGEIVTVETMSDYSCRAAYGRTGRRMSEHAYANALDIRGFQTAKARAANVLAGWGPTTRDAAIQVAAQKAKPSVTLASTAAPAGDLPWLKKKPQPVMAAGMGGFAVAAPSKPAMAVEDAGLGFAFGDDMDGPFRLGGPKDKQGKTVAAKTVVAKPVATNKGEAAFLRAAHTSACRIFGTVLGPEANNAHRNHFHVDMAARSRGGNFCE